MDDRIRAAERSGDRQRLLVELHRAGRKITWQVGDRVIGNNPNAGCYEKPGEVVKVYPNWLMMVTFDEEVKSKIVVDYSYYTLIIAHVDVKPEGC